MRGSLYENIVNLLWISGKVPLLKQAWKAFYFLNYIFAKTYLLKRTGAKHVFLKGSYASGEFTPLVSDIDFVAVFEKESLEEGTEAAKKVGKYAPLVKDVDCFGERSFYERLNFGSLKFKGFKNWRQLDSVQLRQVNRLVYPLKESFDKIQEIYFFIEWIQINLSKKPLTPYRIACAKKACVRALRLAGAGDEWIDWVERSKSREELLASFLEALDSSLDEGLLLEKLRSKLKPDIEEVLSREWFGNTFEIVNPAEGSGNPDKIVLTRRLFETFFTAGALDPAVIYGSLSHTDDNLLNSILLLEYFQGIEDGKTNSLHDSPYDLELTQRRVDSLLVLFSCRTYNGRESFKGATVFVTASWGNDYLKTLAKSHKALRETLGQRVAFLHVSLGGVGAFFNSFQDVMTFDVKLDEKKEGLWHKESLFNLALRICGDAENFIFADIDVTIDEPDWLDKVELLLEKKDAIQGFKDFSDIDSDAKTYSSIAALELKEEAYYAPGLLWAFSRKGIKKLGRFFDYFHDGSNDGVLFKQVTKSFIGVIETLPWTSEEMARHPARGEFSYGYVDTKVSHISHPAKKHYLNMIYMLDLFQPLLSEQTERDAFGLWRWKEEANAEFVELFRCFVRDRGFFSSEFGELFGKQAAKLLEYKSQEWQLCMDSQKTFCIESPVDEAAFYSGSGIENFGLHVFNTWGNFNRKLDWQLGPFKKDGTYCFNYILKSEAKLDEVLKVRLLNCHSETIPFPAFRIGGTRWALPVVFYSWDDFDNPVLNLELEGGTPFSLSAQSFVGDSCSEATETEWAWRGECKGECEEPTEKLELVIDKTFPPLWHKVVVKLEGGVERYQVRVFNERGVSLCTPRIQEDGEDYLTVFFRPAVVSNGIKVEINTFSKYKCRYEAVCFYSEEPLLKDL